MTAVYRFVMIVFYNFFSPAKTSEERLARSYRRPFVCLPIIIIILLLLMKSFTKYILFHQTNVIIFTTMFVHFYYYYFLFLFTG